MNELIEKYKNDMQKALENLDNRFKTVRAGRANPSSLDKVMVDYYSTPTPLKSLATINVPEARILSIKPFDKSVLSEIEKAILKADLGYTPSNDGEQIRIVIPELTEERRTELVKQIKKMAEESKITIRNIRHSSLNSIKELAMNEDEEKHEEKNLQEEVNKYNKKIEELTKEKEKELMTV